MSKRYTFADCVKFAKAHNVSFKVSKTTLNNENDKYYYVFMCDAIDGYLRSENYCYVYNSMRDSFSYSCYHDSYELKKDAMLAHRLCRAFNEDFENIEYDKWCGGCSD